MWRRGCVGLALSLMAGALVGITWAAAKAAPAQAEQPAGFTEQVVFSGLNKPTKLVFAPDGRIFVAEKGGQIMVYDSLTDTTPTLFADLSSEVHDYVDHGLLGMAVAPNFPTNPNVYVLYTADAPIGGTTPTFNDGCPNNVCTVSGRLSTLTASASSDTVVGSEHMLLNDWCDSSDTHSIGTVAFGPDGDLWVSGGDGASADVPDWGQANGGNPCADPPGGTVGAAMNPPAAEGGALKSQSSQRLDGPTLLNGTIIRVDPTTMQGLPDNPYASSSDPNKRRIVAYGLRNPFRFTFRPGTNEVWAGDVGWSTWEEIDRLTNPLAANVTNFGWPCYEGNGHQPNYDQAGLLMCENLYSAGTATAPYYTYNHAAHVVPSESCSTGGSSPTGDVFYPSSGGNYPSVYHGALFWADYSRNCIWAMMPGNGGLPDPNNIQVFDGGASSPVDLEIGPGGDLYYADLLGGTIRRIRYSSTNHPPTASFTATPLSGHPPLAVSFDASASSDPDAGDILTYAWDFDNNGTTDATGVTASHTYSTAGTYTAKLTVTDSSGETSTTTVSINVDNDAPVPVIDTPTTSFHYAVGDTISFTGHANDPQDGAEPASRLHWQAILHHCYTPDNCHTHFIQSWDGVAGASFQAPDHEYPSYLELDLTANDATGASATTTLRLDPQTIPVNFTSNPSGMVLEVGATTGVTPFTTTFVSKASDTISALSPQAVNGTTYTFSNWSDGGAQSHTFVNGTSGTTLTANYAAGGTLPDLTGTVNGNSGPISGATVTLTPDGRSVTTDSNGHFDIPSVNAGVYTVTASLATSQCAAPVSAPVTMSGPQSVVLTLSQKADAFGNTCVDRVGTPAYVPATNPIGLSGDDAITNIATPFPVKLYGATYTSVYLDTNGVLEFINPNHSATTWNTHLGSAGVPVASVFPFWDDFVVDASTTVLTSTTGSAPNRQFTVEWRNVRFFSDANARVTFQAIFSETSGQITLEYQDIDTHTFELGADAVIGLENADATDSFEYSFHQPLLRTGLAITFLPPGAAQAPTGSISGTVRKASDNSVVSGATVTLNPSGASTTTASDGTYHFNNVAYGPYTVTALAGATQCAGLSAAGSVNVGGSATLNLSATQHSDNFGYTCTNGASAYVAGTSSFGLTGDDAIAQLTTPFPISLYGSTYTTAWMDTNGVLSFANPGRSDVTFGQHIPNAAAPNAAVYPLQDDLVLDGSSSTWTATTGSAPNRKFVVEWRNARFYNDQSRVTFEAIFSESNGDITFAYTNLTDGSARAQGSQAVVGIENAAGTDGFEYSFQQPVLSGTSSVTFHAPGVTPPQTGTISGHVTLPNNGGPAAGVTVTLSPGGTTTTASDGSYSFTNVVFGQYTVTAGAGSASCGGQSATAQVNVNGTMTIDLALVNVSRSDTFGYTCTNGASAYVAATTSLALSGDDAIAQVSTPFPVALYGSTYSTAWVDTNGVISFVNPTRSDVTFATHIPNAANPNAAVFPFQDDLVVDGSSSMWTMTTGSAPNRKFIVEWRNARFYNDQSRITFEVIFSESNGDITLAYSNLASGSTRAQGSQAVVGIENATGTDGFEYSFQQPVLSASNSITFHVPGAAPVQTGTISGHVTLPNNGGPAASVPVTLSPGGSTTTASDGSYSFTNVVYGTYTVSAGAGSASCGGQTATGQVTVNGATQTADLALANVSRHDTFGYTCTEGSVAYVAGTTSAGISGDDVIGQITLPFPVTLYGTSYTTAWADTNGVLSFINPNRSDTNFATHIPNAAAPNAVIYPFWDDLYVDGQASIQTATIGSSPNRKFVIEWHNVTFYNDRQSRVNFEIIFTEGSHNFTIVYGTQSATALAKGGAAVMGIENSTGSDGFEYSFQQPVLLTGKSVTFNSPS
jgi:glucose/arabinose dehydrogenase/PKD repeat protein